MDDGYKVLYKLLESANELRDIPVRSTKSVLTTNTGIRILFANESAKNPALFEYSCTPQILFE